MIAYYLKNIVSKFHVDRGKIDEVMSIWASIAPGRVSIQVYELRISGAKLQSVFLKLVIFEVPVHHNSNPTGPIVLKFCTVLLHIIHQVSLGAFLFILIIINFTTTNEPIFLAKISFWLPSATTNLKIENKIKILKNMPFFHRINLTPPPPPQKELYHFFV